MSELYLVLLFLVSGFVIGNLIGMLGIGGGIAFVPLLYIVLPFTDIDKTQISYIAIATSVFAGVLGTASSASRHFFSDNTEIKKGLYLASGSVISAFISPLIAVEMPPHLLQIIFAVIFISVAVKMLLEKSGSTAFTVKEPIKDYYLFLFGLIIGSITGFAGIGGGIIFVPLLVYFYMLNFKKAIGTSSLVTVFTTLSSALSYAIISPKGLVAPSQIGYIYLFSGIPLGIGSAMGALNGVKMVLNTSTSSLKKIFSALLIVIVIKIIFDL